MTTGPEGSARSHSVSVPHERTAVRTARHAFADELAAAGVGGDVATDAMLVLSELVTNAVKHAAPLPSGQILVRWDLRDDVLHIEITDGGARTRPYPTVAALSAVGGRGLDIVRTVSTQWGVNEDQAEGGTVTVWADVARDPAAGFGR